MGMKLKEDIKMTKETKNFKINVRGLLYFPKEEKGKISGCVVISNKLADKIENEVNNSFLGSGLDYECSTVETTDGEQVAGINFKSGYDFPVYDDSGDEINFDQVGFNSIITVSLTFKEYTYKRKRGITAYINGMKVNKLVENTASRITSEELNENVFEDDDLPF